MTNTTGNNGRWRRALLPHTYLSLKCLCPCSQCSSPRHYSTAVTVTTPLHDTRQRLVSPPHSYILRQPHVHLLPSLLLRPLLPLPGITPLQSQERLTLGTHPSPYLLKSSQSLALALIAPRLLMHKVPSSCTPHIFLLNTLHSCSLAFNATGNTPLQSQERLA